MHFLNKLKRYIKSDQQGFSIIELMVAVYIFAIIMVISSGAVMAILRNQKLLLKEQELLDNARGSLEVMSKAIRIGADYSVPASPNNTEITFSHPTKKGVSDCPSTGSCPVKYYLSTAGGVGKIYEQNCPSGCGGVLGCGSVMGGPGCRIPLTSDQVNIKKLEFIPTGFGTSDTHQARVTIYVEFVPVISTISNRAIPIQTTLVQRQLDIP